MISLSNTDHEAILFTSITLLVYVAVIFALVLYFHLRSKKLKNKIESASLISNQKGIVNAEAIKEIETSESGMKDWEEIIELEYHGHKIRMTEYQRLYVWPTLTREQKRAQVQPVAEWDREEITDADGNKVWTNKKGTSKNAKKTEKQIRNYLNKNQSVIAKKRK